MAEVALATEVLPVRLLAPALEHVLIAQGIHMFEVQQRGHQPRGQGRAPGGRDELRAPLVRKRLPVDECRQPNQFVPLVDQVEQFGAEQVVLRGGF
jgi:hypothetical protein